MIVEEWCYKHNCALSVLPISGLWQYVCPECAKESQTVSTQSTNTVIRCTTEPIYHMMVHGVPENGSVDKKL